MIKLLNGKIIRNCVAASGSLAYTGRGWFWEWPLRWLKILQPEKLSVITKTITCAPVKGNLSWYHPWSCVKILGQNSVLNAVAFTNPGFNWWKEKCYPLVKSYDYDIILSIGSSGQFSKEEFRNMVLSIKGLDLVALEFNGSCPNIKDRGCPDFDLLEIIKKEVPELPLIVKVSVKHDENYILELEHFGCSAIDAVNTIPYSDIFSNASPLATLGGGGVSGQPIFERALDYIKNLSANTNLKIIGGGGITNLETARKMAEYADSISLGTLFLTNPCVVKDIVSAAEGFTYRKS